jgi:hypothetical protein
MTYKFIKIEPVPQPLEDILDASHPTSKAIAAEVAVANAAPLLLAALKLFANIDRSTGSDLWAIRKEYCDLARNAIAKAEAQ